MDFNQALNFVFEKEGGFNNDKADRGGATNFGISQKNHPNIDVSKITKDDAAKIYKEKYWDQVGADSLPPEFRLAAFDTAVQHGVGTARKMIEASGGDINKLINDRKQLYSTIVANNPSQAKFAKGWDNRINSVAAASTSQPQLQNAPAQKTGNMQAQVEQQVTEWARQGLGDAYIVQKLTDAGFGPEIKDALSQGYQASDVVAGYGGQRLAEVKAAKAKVESQGFGTNLVAGAVQAGSDMATGAGQLVDRVTGDDASLKRSQQEQIRLEQDPTYQAQSETAGSKIGNFGVKALPYIAGTLIAPEATLPMIGANMAAGGVSGALTPTTGDGQFASNVGTEAVLGGVGAGGAKVASKLFKSAGNAAAKSVAGADARTYMSPAMRSEYEQVGMKTLQQKAINQIGQTGDEITPEVVANARANIYTKPNALLENTKIPANTLQDIGGELDSAITKYRLNTPKTDQSRGIFNYSRDLKTAISSGDFTGSQLLSYRKNIADAAFNATTSSERTALHEIVSAIDSHLARVAPEASDALKVANKQWRTLQSVEKMVDKTNGQDGLLTPQRFADAIKQSNRDAFQAGNAPLQELADAAMKLRGLDLPKTVAGSLAKGVHSNLFDSAAMLGTVVHPASLAALGGRKLISKLLDKYALAKAPTIDKFLVSAADSPGAITDATRAYMAKAIGGSVAPAVEKKVAAEEVKPLMLGYSPAKPATTSPLYVAKDGTAGNDLISVKHAARVNSQIPDSVLASAALKNAPNDVVNAVAPEVVQAAKVVETKAALPADKKAASEAILAEIRARKGELGAKPSSIKLPNDTPSTAFEIQHTTTELEDAAMQAMGKGKKVVDPNHVKDPMKVAQMNIVRLTSQLAKESNPGRRKIIQMQIDAAEKILGK